MLRPQRHFRGALLHIGTAILMRLNTFLWAFLATYPAVIFCATT
ncbi:hypothetical protein [Nocardia tengchongensis]